MRPLAPDAQALSTTPPGSLFSSAVMKAWQGWNLHLGAQPQLGSRVTPNCPHCFFPGSKVPETRNALGTHHTLGPAPLVRDAACGGRGSRGAVYARLRCFGDDRRWVGANAPLLPTPEGGGRAAQPSPRKGVAHRALIGPVCPCSEPLHHTAVFIRPEQLLSPVLERSLDQGLTGEGSRVSDAQGMESEAQAPGRGCPLQGLLPGSSPIPLPRCPACYLRLVPKLKPSPHPTCPPPPPICRKEERSQRQGKRAEEGLWPERGVGGGIWGRREIMTFRSRDTLSLPVHLYVCVCFLCMHISVCICTCFYVYLRVYVYL
ncbi:uncharacterized protein LOC114023045 [Vombatus ursinus]|uniref:uncharacterized protein LOC114023045 n=1 Tax=Vombatus ursinus TaxID=29139 RepID=UPI000FFCF419|nr:uncharacterized protein LOC114023045 [Vombatus ursinus]